jgi:hypothetical protein
MKCSSPSGPSAWRLEARHKMSNRTVPTRARAVSHHVMYSGGFDDVIRVIRDDLRPPSGSADDYFLRDLLRRTTDWRLALARLADMSARCPTNRGRYALANWITQLIDGRCAQSALPLSAAMLAEDRSQHEGDDAIRAVTLVREPSVTVLRVATERVHAHIRSLGDLARALARRMVESGDARRTW